MLNPIENRLDYGKILTPPEGFYLDFAVGATYSLNLDALVGVCLALGLSEETDSVLMNNPICLLEALRSTGDKIALFCEGGQIHMPDTPTPLFILLEKMVFSIAMPKRSGIAAYPSFHPKFWLIRYANETKEYVYRVIVLSRNLTFDRSWDISYYMDGRLRKSASDKNEPLCDFLRFLAKQTSADESGKNKAKEIRALIRELSYVHFEPPEKEFYDYEFVPGGIKKSSGVYYRFEKTELFTDTFHEILIISPFLSSSIIKDFNDRNVGSPIQGSRYILITRGMSLERLKLEDVDNFRIYTMKDSVIDGECAISEEKTEAKKQDIHAKLFMKRKHSDSSLYLGSLNASHNAVYGNVELMLRLDAKNRYLSMDKLTASLFGEDEQDNPFQEETLQNAIIDIDDDETNNLHAVIKEINRSNPSAFVKENVQKDTEKLFSVTVNLLSVDTGDFKVRVKPLFSNKTAALAEKILFTDLQLTQLSEFYAISVSDNKNTVERIIMIPTRGIPENRENAVVSHFVNNEKNFYRYIAFLLGDDPIVSALEVGVAEGDGQSKPGSTTYGIPALYEKMLQTAANNPKKFKDIEHLMKAVSEDGIIPEDFKKLYDTFKKAVKLDV
jgi:hypothetical protein